MCDKLSCKIIYLNSVPWCAVSTLRTPTVPREAVDFILFRPVTWGFLLHLSKAAWVEAFSPIFTWFNYDITKEETIFIILGVASFLSRHKCKHWWQLLIGDIYIKTSCIHYGSYVPLGVDSKWRNVLIALGLELLIATLGFAVALRAYLFTANQRAGCFWAQVVVSIVAQILTGVESFTLHINLVTPKDLKMGNT